MSKLIVMGDKHIRSKEPYRSSVIDVLDWFLTSEYNSPENIYLSLGDETEESINKGMVNDILISFYKNLKMEQKFILQGNHDISHDYGSNLDIFNSDTSVDVITEPVRMKWGNTSCLLLPFKHNTKDYSMEDEYSSLNYEETFDYCFGHVFDETRKFSEKQKVCDLSNLKIKQRVFGHDHTFNLNSKGNYLGSIHPNSSSEKNKTPYIYVIDMETGKGEAVPIPLFLNYYDVSYPDTLPELSEKYQILRITDYLDRDDAIDFYKSEMLKQNKELFIRRMERKKFSAILEEKKSEYETGISTTQHMENYFMEKNVDQPVADIVRSALSKKS